MHTIVLIKGTAARAQLRRAASRQDILTAPSRDLRCRRAARADRAAVECAGAAPVPLTARLAPAGDCAGGWQGPEPAARGSELGWARKPPGRCPPPPGRWSARPARISAAAPAGAACADTLVEICDNAPRHRCDVLGQQLTHRLGHDGEVQHVFRSLRHGDPSGPPHALKPLGGQQG
jgi:hypothetical protein